MGLVVSLDCDDDFASARSKLTGADGRAALVIPSDCPAMSRTLSFQLLRRWCQDNAVELTIVTRDAPLKRLANDFGFRTCSSVRSVQDRWREDDKLRTAPAWEVWLVRQRFSFVRWALTLGAVGLGAFWLITNYLPLATVRLTPLTQPFADRLEITADPAVAAVDYVRLLVPARIITAKVEASDRLPATGKKEENARGFVTFANLTDNVVRLPQNTIVATSTGKKYSTTSDAVIPGPKWSAVRVEVLAAEVGAKGETGRLTVNMVEGPLASQVAVLNEQPIAVDKSRQTPVIVAADREKLRASLLDRLTKQALSSLNSQLKQSEVLTPQSVKVDVVQEEYDRAVGDEAPLLTLRLALQASGTVYDQRQVSDLARKSRETRSQGTRQIVPESLKVSPPQLLGFRGDAVAFAVNVEGLTIQSIDESEVRRLVVGRSAAEAAAALQRSLGLVRPPEVTIDPAWATRANRVQVIIEGVAASE